MEEQILPISDFEKLYQHTLNYSEASQTTENIAKIYFYEITNLLNSDVIAVDIQNRVAQINPDEQQRFGEKKFDIELSEKDLKSISDILKENNVDTWKDEHTYGSDDILAQMGGEGYNWALFIQYKDGTMADKRGKGTSKEKIQPEGYENFVKELNAFVASKKD